MMKHLNRFYNCLVKSSFILFQNHCLYKQTCLIKKIKFKMKEINKKLLYIYIYIYISYKINLKHPFSNFIIEMNFIKNIFFVFS